VLDIEYRQGRIEYRRDYPPPQDMLPQHLPFLERLSLSGTVPMKMKEVQMPALKELDINLDESVDSFYDTTYDEELYERPIFDLLGCKDVPFGKLETLGIKLRHGTPVYMNDDKLGAYRRLLRVCGNVKSISSDKSSIYLILKLLEEECLDNTAIVDRTFVLSDGEMSREMRAGREEKLEDIRAMAVELGWSTFDEDRRHCFKEFLGIHYTKSSGTSQFKEDEDRSPPPLDLFDV
jgi:hypothetical protein